MAIGVTLKAGTGDVTNLTIYTTASVTLAANTLMLVFVCLNNGTTGRTATCTATGLTFSRDDSWLWGPTNNSMSTHTAQVGAGGFTGTVTITGSGSCQQAIWAVLEVTGAHATTPVVQVSGQQIGTGTNFSAPLPSGTPASVDSRTFCAAAHAVFEGTTPGANITELSDSALNSPATSFAAGWRSDAFQQTPAMSCATSGVWGMIAVEIAVAPAGGATAAPAPRPQMSTLLAR